MKIGIGIADFSWPIGVERIGSTVERIARTAEDAGFDSLWAMDHFFQIRITGHPPESPMLEVYSLLSYLAGITRRITLGTMVTSVSYRHPGVLVKTATTLDVLSGGRTVFGVGAGAPFDPEPMGPGTAWEAEGLGIPFGRLPERFERLAEVLRLARQMWSGDETPFEGKHYQLARPLNSPNSVRRPHPPILIGGSGERKTLRLVAQYADACNLFDLPEAGYVDNLSHKLNVLRKHCDDVGRDYAEIEKTVTTIWNLNTDPDPAAFVAHMADLSALGIEHALVDPRGPWTDETLAVLAAALPELHAL